CLPQYRHHLAVPALLEAESNSGAAVRNRSPAGTKLPPIVRGWEPIPCRSKLRSHSVFCCGIIVKASLYLVDFYNKCLFSWAITQASQKKTARESAFLSRRFNQ